MSDHFSQSLEGEVHRFGSSKKPQIYAPHLVFGIFSSEKSSRTVGPQVLGKMGCIDFGGALAAGGSRGWLSRVALAAGGSQKMLTKMQ